MIAILTQYIYIYIYIYIYTPHYINIKLNTIKLKYLTLLIKLRSVHVVVHWTFGRGDGISKPKIGQFPSPNIVFVFLKIKSLILST